MGLEWLLSGPLGTLTPCEQAGLAYELMEPYLFRPMRRGLSVVERVEKGGTQHAR